MRVNLIGGKEEGLPIEHPLVICVDIGDRTDLEVYMKYNEETGEFYWEEPIIVINNAELREQSYETLKCITWESTEITVDEANKLFLNYFAENNPKANEIQPLIIEAKEYIRTLYPDSEE